MNNQRPKKTYFSVKLVRENIYLVFFQSEGGVIYTFKKPATEWGLKKLLIAELEDCQEGTHYMILVYGIHGSGNGHTGRPGNQYRRECRWQDGTSGQGENC